MRHVGEASDQNHAVKGIQIPRHAADQRLRPERKESNRADGNDVAESQYNRREEDRHEQPGLEKFLSRQIGAHKQKRQQTAERNRDQCHAEGNQQRGAEGGVKTGISENVTIGAEAQGGRRAKESFAKKTLVNDEPQRSEDHQAYADHREGTESPAHKFIFSVLPSTVS